MSPWRRTSGGGVVREERFEPVVGDEAVEVVRGERPEDPFGLREPERRSAVRRRPVAIALVTGLLAFAIVAVVVTASELTLFDDADSSRSRTTFFGGESSRATPTPEPSFAPEGTPAPGATPTPAPEATVTPEATLPPAAEGTHAPEASPAPVAPTAAP